MTVSELIRELREIVIKNPKASHQDVYGPEGIDILVKQETSGVRIEET